ncbi:asparagine synthase (glutamine-hydrolyzing) [Ignavibacterium album]|uniref:asparagine synthase (glutamine-hydrolyzing) n=1 Tax=Ignavibacterium album TaxID=591197 RepID=UPI0035B852E8
MCGIFGVINTKEVIDESRVIAARDILAHRGSDDAGIYFSFSHSSNQPNVALAHRRLSIIDLSPAGHQPMTTNDGRFTIVYNGEIYNYKSLIPNPSPKENRISNPNPSANVKEIFKSHSDTEVILYLYSKYGKDCLNMLRGMFAFAIWDDLEKTLFAARDRFGIKPFYYFYDENDPPAGEASFIFSSELKAIKEYKKNLTTNYKALDAFLKTGSVPAPMTIYNEVNSLMPGYFLEWQKSKVKCQKYWEFSYLIQKSSVTSYQSANNNSESYNHSTIQSFNHSTIQSINHSITPSRKYDDNARRIIRESLLDTIKAHMVADVEVGAFLSGGIDSTAIVSLMRQVGKEKIKTVSIVFPDSKFDESKYSRLAAKRYNTEHIEIPFTEKDLLDDFEYIMSVMDQPTIDGINTYFVSKAAKQAGLKVVLSGLGGDELFGGYPSFHRIPKYMRIKNLPFAKMFMKAAAVLLKNKLPAKAIHYMKNPNEPNAEYKLIRGLFTEEELQTMRWNFERQKIKVKSEKLATNGTMTINDKSHFDPPRRAGYAQCDTDTSFKGLSDLQSVSYLETSFYMRNQLLRDSDVFSMAHSLELRVPFVDHKLYEAALPWLDDAYDKNFPKKMLVEAVGDLPDEIVHRPKMGFTFPFEDWIRNGQLKDLINEKLKVLEVKLNIEHLPAGSQGSKLNIEGAHWSRMWALFVLSKYND